MAAAPFKAVLKFATESGKTFFYNCTVSDVNAEFYVFPDGQSFVNLPSNDGVVQLFDVILSAAGTDTTTATVFVNGKSTGQQVQNSANLASNQARQFAGTPIAFQPGANLRLTQNT